MQPVFVLVKAKKGLTEEFQGELLRLVRESRIATSCFYLDGEYTAQVVVQTENTNAVRWLTLQLRGILGVERVDVHYVEDTITMTRDGP